MFDIVTVKSRTGKVEEFMENGIVRLIDPKKGLKIPRGMAQLAVEQNALRWAKENGQVTESKVYIEDDIPEGEPAPKTISAEEIKAIKRTSGIGSGKILVDGKLVDMKAIDINPES